MAPAPPPAAPDYVGRASASSSKEPPPVRAGEKRIVMEKVEGHVEPLSEQPRFCLATAALCSIRVLRLALLNAGFSDGPHTEDGGAMFGITCAWLAVVNCFIGSLLLLAPLRQWAESQGISPQTAWYVEPVTLSVLAIAVVFDLLHQLMAVISWKYFWGTGVASDEEEDLMLLAYVLILLHVVGLLGLVMLVAAYARCFHASYRDVCKGPPPAVSRDSAADLESGSGGGARNSRSSAGGDTQAAWGRKGWTCPFCDERNNESRSECNNCGRVRPPETFADEQAASEQASHAGPVGGKPQARASSSGPRTAASAPNPTPTMGTTERPPVGTPPRAWLWMDETWVKVRVMRSSSEGFATVRLPGGAVVNTRQFLLRPRSDGDEPPSGAPPSRPSGARPSSASADGRPRRSSKHSSGSQPGSNSTGAPRASSAPPPGSVRESRPAAELSAEERWAAERLTRLRKELQALDGKTPAERRSGLRGLQRELHPDKQPPELRVHAQPLFMLVQKEWEVDEAAARGAASEAAEG